MANGDRERHRKETPKPKPPQRERPSPPSPPERDYKERPLYPALEPPEPWPDPPNKEEGQSR